MLDRIIWWVGAIHIAAYALALGSFVIAWCFHRVSVYFGFIADMLTGIFFYRRHRAAIKAAKEVGNNGL